MVYPQKYKNYCSTLYVPPIPQQIQISVDQPYAAPAQLPAVALSAGHICVVHLQDKVTPSTKALWPGASFQNRSY
jgi:hypothetical protein